MKSKIIQISKNVIHRTFLDVPHNFVQRIALLSDIHWDNPHCRRDVLKADLEKARQENARVAINGDFFCFMQGRYDPRRAKSDIRPEHNVNNYIDAVIEDAVEWWLPYADMIDFIGLGNHETSIKRHLETDPLRRFIDMLNFRAKSEVKMGGYGGWYVISFKMRGSTSQTSYKINYFHGFGGGGPVTKGTIQDNRRSVQIDGADCVWMGHVHEDYEVTYMKERLSSQLKVKLKQELHVRTPTYKEEYEDGSGGYHVEKGRPPKPLGGRFLELEVTHKQKDNKKELKVLAHTRKITGG
jgi:hypothetical protein